jgi:hypothetical protein
VELTSPKATSRNRNHSIALQPPSTRLRRGSPSDSFVTRTTRHNVQVLTRFFALDGGTDGEVVGCRLGA